MEKIKQEITEVLWKAINEYSEQVSNRIDIEKKEIKDLIEIPPSIEMGDYAFPCYYFSKQLKIPPHQIALNIRKNIHPKNIKETIRDIQTSGPYINFILDKKIMASKILKEIFNDKKEFGQPDNPPASDKEGKKGKKIKSMVEFPSPNTNKPLHIGHLRNMVIGESVSKILEFSGEEVVRANLNNDRGIHICKSMAAYQYHAGNKTPKHENKKPDHFVGDYYVLFGKNAKKDGDLERESHRMLQRYEQGDKETLELWKKMNNWALEGFKETYEKLGIKHDKEYFESNLYEKGKDIVQEGLKKGLFEKDKHGGVVVKFPEKDLGEKYLLRQDGTSLYITQDLYLAKIKFDEYNLDKSIYLTNHEQKYHFNVLFRLLEMLDIADRKRMEHLAYGEVFLPGWKRIKSRQGTEGVTVDEIIDNVTELVKKELKSRPENKNLSEKTIDKRSRIIALACIKYVILKIDMNKNMIFDPKKSMDFEGNTGSYLLYTYARASSILRKIKTSDSEETEEDESIEELRKEEQTLIKKLSLFEKVVSKAYKESNPSLIANYTFELAQIFNEFYHACPVMKSKRKNFRKKLVHGFKRVMKNSLDLLGIEPLEKM